MQYKQNIKQKNIEAFLQDNIDEFENFENDKFMLEQHITPPEIGAQILHYINKNEDVQNSLTIDLGCGTGCFLGGILYLGGQCIGVEIDKDYSQKTYEQFSQQFDQSQFDIINCDVSQFQCRQMFDLVITNPPFGTKIEGQDMVFIECAHQICTGNIYSLHKSSTRDFLQQKAEKLGRKFVLIHEFKEYPLKRRFQTIQIELSNKDKKKLKDKTGKKKTIKNYHKEEVQFTSVDFVCYQKIN